MHKQQKQEARLDLEHFVKVLGSVDWYTGEKKYYEIFLGALGVWALSEFGFLFYLST